MAVSHNIHKETMTLCVTGGLQDLPSAGGHMTYYITKPSKNQTMSKVTICLRFYRGE